MKKLACALILSTLIAPPATAATPDPNRGVIIQLSVIQAHKSMLSLCGVTGDEAAKLLAKDTELETKLQAGLNEEGKKSAEAELAKIEAGVKTSWEQTPEDQRAKSCEALKASMSK